MTRAKYIVALLALCVICTSGGCGGSNSDSGANSEGVNSAWTGAWTASSGTASVKAESEDYTLSVQNIALILDNCDVEDSQGTAKMTVLVILSGDVYLPVFFKDLTLSTDRISEDSWTASTPHGELSITLTDDGKADFSGNVNYFGYDCEFTSSISKVRNTTAALRPENVLDGTWKYDEERAGGYRYANGEMSLLIPRYITACFNGTTADSTIATTTGFIMMPILAGGKYDEDNVMSFQFVNTESPSNIANLYGNIYTMSSAQTSAGIDAMIFMHSETQMHMLMSWVQSGSQLCILLPLTKVQESEDTDIAERLSRKWTALGGGGVMTPSADTSMRVNLRLESCDLTFSDVQISGGRGSAEISAAGTFASDVRTVNLDAFQNIAIDLEELGINLWRAVTAKGSKVYISILSDTQALVIADIVYDGAEKCLLTAVLTPSE